MWGSCSRTRWNNESSGTVSDEDLQAQAWLPSCLRSLLAEVRYSQRNPFPSYLPLHTGETQRWLQALPLFNDLTKSGLFSQPSALLVLL